MAPALFGLAHVHHFFRPESTIVGTLFQVAFTAVFGMLSSAIFLRTGSVVPPILVHMFCNILGFPPLGDMSRAELVLTTVGGVSFFFVFPILLPVLPVLG